MEPITIMLGVLFSFIWGVFMKWVFSWSIIFSSIGFGIGWFGMELFRMGVSS